MAGPNTSEKSKISAGEETRSSDDVAIGESQLEGTQKRPNVPTGQGEDAQASPCIDASDETCRESNVDTDMVDEMVDTSVTPASHAITQIVIGADRAGTPAGLAAPPNAEKIRSIEGFKDTEPVPSIQDWKVQRAQEDGPTRIVHPGVPDARGSLPLFIGPYRILDCLGEGGMGEVFRALSLEANRLVAIKRLRSGASKEIVEQFEREIRFLHKVDHPNICKVYDSGMTEEGQAYFVMKYVEGVLLETLLDVSPPPLWKVTELCGQIAAGLSACHSQGIAHRDLKPRNVIVNAEDGCPVVVDFGIALQMDTEGAKGAGPRKAMGTPAYMSPEQVLGKDGSSGVSMDIWGLGIILFESISGYAPFGGRTDNEIMENVLHSDLPELLDRGGYRVDGELEALIRKCLARDPKDRFASMDDLASALNELTARRIEALPFRTPESASKKTVTLDLENVSTTAPDVVVEQERISTPISPQNMATPYAWRGALLWVLMGVLFGIALGFWIAT